MLIVGSSGKGKSYMMRTLDKTSTGYINVENQPLPFKNEFKNHERPTTGIDTITTLIKYAKDDSIKVIVVDSFSAYMDLVLKEARQTKRGFDVWTEYNTKIAEFHEILNKIQKEVLVTGHYEILDVEGTPEKRLRVHGREHEGRVERYYTVALFADSKYDEEGKSEYFLRLSGEGISAKCPPDIFGPEVVTIPNDAKYIIDKITEFAE
ncbi:AAA family ATPase [Mesotoga prima]|uniref:AAA family ATPase n=1 Tax=Mesotoga prima TaxID=1184387 RepID=UPI002FD91C12